jgi:hypothetical protein
MRSEADEQEEVVGFVHERKNEPFQMENGRMHCTNYSQREHLCIVPIQVYSKFEFYLFINVSRVHGPNLSKSVYYLGYPEFNIKMHPFQTPLQNCMGNFFPIMHNSRAIFQSILLFVFIFLLYIQFQSCPLLFQSRQDMDASFTPRKSFNSGVFVRSGLMDRPPPAHAGLTFSIYLSRSIKRTLSF